MLTFLYTNTVFGGANVIVPFLSDSRRNSFEYFSFARISHYCIRCLHCSLSESRFLFVHHHHVTEQKGKDDQHGSAPLRGYCLLARRALLFQQIIT